MQGRTQQIDERGSYREKGASGAFRMRERGSQRVWGTEVPQWGPGAKPR